MSKDNNFITILGTGNALATRCYNTCFTLYSNSGAVSTTPRTGRSKLVKKGTQQKQNRHSAVKSGCQTIWRKSFWRDSELRDFVD